MSRHVKTSMLGDIAPVADWVHVTHSRGGKRRKDWVVTRGLAQSNLLSWQWFGRSKRFRSISNYISQENAVVTWSCIAFLLDCSLLAYSHCTSNYQASISAICSPDTIQHMTRVSGHVTSLSSLVQRGQDRKSHRPTFFKYVLDTYDTYEFYPRTAHCRNSEAASTEKAEARYGALVIPHH